MEMWRANHVRDTLTSHASEHYRGMLGGGGAVVDSRQEVRMDVDHAGRARLES
jgi:hypothetical protein